MVVGEKPKSKSRSRGWWHFELTGFPRTEEEEFSSWLHVTRRVSPAMLPEQTLGALLGSTRTPSPSFLSLLWVLAPSPNIFPYNFPSTLT